MKSAALLVIGMLMALTGLLSASDEAPRWGVLGDDDQLKFKFQQSREVALVCVFDTEVRRIPHSNPKIQSPFADIVFHATVVSIHKGSLKIGRKIKIRFLTDSLEGDADQQRKFIEVTNEKNKGALKFAFLKQAKDGEFACEWLDLPEYRGEMQDFLKGLEAKSPESHSDAALPASEAMLVAGSVLTLKEHDISSAPMLQGAFVVTNKGEVNLPYLGPVVVAGLKKSQAIRKITDAWSAAGMQVK